MGRFSTVIPGKAGSVNGSAGHAPMANPSTRSTDSPGQAPPLLAPPRRRQRPAIWGLALTLVAGGGALAAITVTAAGDRVAVLTIVRPVPAGDAITAADLGVARIAPDPQLHPVSERDKASVLGQLAAVDLRPGGLLTRSQLTTVGIPGPGQALVGISLKPGQLPARPLQRGDRLLVVVTATADGGSAPASRANLSAVVAEVGPPTSDGTTVVDLVVARADSLGLAADAAAGRLYLVLLPRTGTP